MQKSRQGGCYSKRIIFRSFFCLEAFFFLGLDFERQSYDLNVKDMLFKLVFGQLQWLNNRRCLVGKNGQKCSRFPTGCLALKDWPARIYLPKRVTVFNEPHYATNPIVLLLNELEQ